MSFFKTGSHMQYLLQANCEYSYGLAVKHVTGTNDKQVCTQKQNKPKFGKIEKTDKTDGSNIEN